MYIYMILYNIFIIHNIYIYILCICMHIQIYIYILYLWFSFVYQIYRLNLYCSGQRAYNSISQSWQVSGHNEDCGIYLIYPFSFLYISQSTQSIHIHPPTHPSNPSLDPLLTDQIKWLTGWLMCRFALWSGRLFYHMLLMFVRLMILDIS